MCYLRHLDRRNKEQVHRRQISTIRAEIQTVGSKLKARPMERPVTHGLQGKGPSKSVGKERAEVVTAYNQMLQVTDLSEWAQTNSRTNISKSLETHRRQHRHLSSVFQEYFTAEREHITQVS